MLASCADRDLAAGTGPETEGDPGSGSYHELLAETGTATVPPPAPALGPADGAAPESLPGTAAAAVPDAARPADTFPSRADLFDIPGAGTPPRDLLDDVADDLSRDGNP